MVKFIENKDVILREIKADICAFKSNYKSIIDTFSNIDLIHLVHPIYRKQYARRMFEAKMITEKEYQTKVCKRLTFTAFEG